MTSVSKIPAAIQLKSHWQICLISFFGITANTIKPLKTTMLVGKVNATLPGTSYNCSTDNPASSILFPEFPVLRISLLLIQID